MLNSIYFDPHCPIWALTKPKLGSPQITQGYEPTNLCVTLVTRNWHEPKVILLQYCKRKTQSWLGQVTVTVTPNWEGHDRHITVPASEGIQHDTLFLSGDVSILYWFSSILSTRIQAWNPLSSIRLGVICAEKAEGSDLEIEGLVALVTVHLKRWDSWEVWWSNVIIWSSCLWQLLNVSLTGTFKFQSWRQ